MFEFIADVKENDEHLKRIYDALKELKSLEVLVGIPEAESSRDDEINNAELLYIHTNGAKRKKMAGELYKHSKGSPLSGIPPRPVLEPAISDDKEQIAELLKQASQSALEGNIDAMRQNLEKAGMRGMNVSRAWFTNPKNNWLPIQQEAISRREKKMSAKKLAEAKEQNKPHMPLIDTGELRKSISYVVKKR